MRWPGRRPRVSRDVHPRVINVHMPGSKVIVGWHLHLGNPPRQRDPHMGRREPGRHGGRRRFQQPDFRQPGLLLHLPASGSGLRFVLLHVAARAGEHAHPRMLYQSWTRPKHLSLIDDINFYR